MLLQIKLDKTELALQNAIKDRWYIISSSNPFKFYFDVFIILLAIYNAIFLPMRTGFIQVDDLYEESMVLIVVEILVDCFFIIDMVLAFFTEYLDTTNGEKFRSPKKIAKNYIKSGFTFDLIATIPGFLRLIFNATMDQSS